MRARGAGPGRGLALALVLLPLLAGGCGRSYENAATARAELARRVAGSVALALVDDPGMPSYLEGARLAAARINAAGGVLGGRPLEIRVYPGGDRFEEVRPTVERIASDPRIVAVLGHRDSRVALPASAIYQSAGVLFMPPFATARALTRHGFDKVLRMLPDSAALAAQSASVSALLGYRRMAVLHARDDDSREQAFLFEDAARKEGIDIVFRGSFFADREAAEGERELLDGLAALPFDALYLSAGTAAGARVLARLRALGLHQPAIGSDRLNEGGLERYAAQAGERTLVPTLLDPDDPATPMHDFVAAFERAYGRAPDAPAAQGSDSVALLAALIERSGDVDPGMLSATARFGRPWAGLTGIYAFDATGDLFGKHYRFQVLRSGRWWPLPGMAAPYLLSSLGAWRRERALEAAVAAGAGDAPEPPVAEGVAPGFRAGPGDARTPAGAPRPDEPDLAALGRRDLGPLERDLIWLAVAKEILKFERLGVMVPPGEQGRASAELARALGDRLGLKVAVCALPAAATTPGSAEAAQPPQPADGAPAAAPRDPLERAALACYGRLALEVDAMLTVTDGSLDPRWLRRLNRTLLAYRIPAFALARSLDADYGLTLALIGSGTDLQAPLVAGRFGGLLHGVGLGELSRKLADLPTVSLDLEALAALGRHPDPRELTVVSRVLESGDPPPTSPSPRAPAKTIGSKR